MNRVELLVLKRAIETKKGPELKALNGAQLSLQRKNEPNDKEEDRDLFHLLFWYSAIFLNHVFRNNK